MATLILSAVGTAVGGPIGGAIGALIGQQADAAIFAPKRRQGPRLADLAVQTSSYGTPIPKIFGRMRVAGTVIWSTDLIERRTSSGGGKGRPATTGYTYSASFAVALSARPIGGVGRIWADGKLLRGAGGDFKSETGFRLHLGGEAQAVDPLIAAAEGIGSTPAYRGLAYAVFEDMQLADFGNRIPSLSFEVEAEMTPVAVGTIAAELAAGAMVAGATPALIGYAAGGDTVRGAIEGLAGLMDLSLVDSGSVLSLATASGPPFEPTADESGARATGDVGGRTEIATASAAAAPAEVAMTYVDPARDWQASLQRVRRERSGSGVERVALPAAATAEVAKAIAEARLAALWSGRSSARLHLGWRRAALRPGDLLRIAGAGGLWRVERWTLHRMLVTLDLVCVASGGPSTMPASPGRPVREADLAHGPTVARLLDIAVALGPVEDRPRLLIAAAGPEAGWRRAELEISMDGGASWAAAGRTAAPAVIGSAVTILPAAGAALFDAANHVDVELLSDAMWLENCDDAALIDGANLALLGGELIQFGRAEPLGDRRFRLSRLLRGRRGTEWAAGAHEAGEPFTLIAADTLASVEMPLAAIGGEIRLTARGPGDAAPAEAAVTATGEMMRPPTPAHLRAERRADGDIAISWVRRSRAGWTWLDGADAPLAEEQEAYRLTLATGSSVRTVMVAGPEYLHTSAAQAGDGGGPITVAVSQIGTFAASRAAIITVERP